ncbi:MAG: UDP-N-acetylmuramoyl-tripeptide--D-alanyl-D-alanine ligase [Acidimicrobiia bacterium]
MIFNIDEIISALENQTIDKHITDLNTTYKKVVFDSRKVETDSIFIALVGEESNGAKYIEDACLNGARLVVANDTDRVQAQDSLDNFSNVNVIYVKDSLVAFGKIGSLARDKFDGVVVGVIGSVGKTTTKNMLRELGGSLPKVYASRGSFNNQTGVPLTLCEVEEGCERLIVELGESHFGDLEYITEISRPHHLVVTNVALAHTAYLIDKDGVAKTFLETISRIPKDGYIVMPFNIDKKETLLGGATSNVVFTIDKSEENGIDLNENYSYITATKSNSDLTNDISLDFNGKKVNAHIPLIGKHFVENAALAITMSLICGDDPADIETNMLKMKPQGHRMRLVKNEDLLLIDDAYNANPESMRACIDAVQAIAKNNETRSVFIMGPMRELGELSDERHISMAEYANEIGIDTFICVGEATKPAFKSNSHKNSYYFDTVKDAINNLESIIEPNDVVGVKASRGPDASMPALVPIVNFLSELKWNVKKNRNEI